MIPWSKYGVVAFLAVGFGFICGFLVNRNQGPESGASSGSKKSQLRPHGIPAQDELQTPDQLDSTEEEVRSLRKRLLDQEEEISRLREMVKAAEGIQDSREATKEEKRATAERLCHLWSNSDHLTEEERKEMLRLYADLGPGHSPFLAELYRSKIKAGKYDSAIMSLLWNAGGVEVVDLLNERISGGGDIPGERQALLNFLSGVDATYASYEKLPISEPMGRKAREWVVSQNRYERAAGAGLLGGVDTIESRQILTGMVADPDLGVQAAAIKSLGRIGDSSTLDYLLTYLRTQSRNLIGPNAPDVRKALDAAIKKLSERSLKK